MSASIPSFLDMSTLLAILNNHAVAVNAALLINLGSGTLETAYGVPWIGTRGSKAATVA